MSNKLFIASEKSVQDVMKRIDSLEISTSSRKLGVRLLSVGEENDKIFLSDACKEGLKYNRYTLSLKDNSNITLSDCGVDIKTFYIKKGPNISEYESSLLSRHLRFSSGGVFPIKGTDFYIGFGVFDSSNDHVISVLCNVKTGVAYIDGGDGSDAFTLYQGSSHYAQLGGVDWVSGKYILSGTKYNTSFAKIWLVKPDLKGDPKISIETVDGEKLESATEVDRFCRFAHNDIIYIYDGKLIYEFNKSDAAETEYPKFYKKTPLAKYTVEDGGSSTMTEMYREPIIYGNLIFIPGCNVFIDTLKKVAWQGSPKRELKGAYGKIVITQGGKTIGISGSCGFSNIVSISNDGIKEYTFETPPLGSYLYYRGLTEANNPVYASKTGSDQKCGLFEIILPKGVI